METILLIIHVLVCFALIFIVLVQGGKGAELGAAFGGGSSQTLFGGRGAATFLGKMTTWVAVVFMISSLLLAMASMGTDSVVKGTAPSQQQAVPTQTVPVPVSEQPVVPAQPVPSAPADTK